MNFFAYHEAKSKYAYLYDKNTLHLRLLVSEGTGYSVEVFFGDPFMWGKLEENDNQWGWKMDPSSPMSMTKEATMDGIDHFFVSIAPTVKRFKYAFIINHKYLVSSRGIIDLETAPEQKTNLFHYFNYPFLNEEDLFLAPDWVKDQVWYSIFPERFCNGDFSLPKTNIIPWGEVESYSNEQRFGGDLRGIIQSIPYLKEVGFTGIYMTPIFVSDTSHKYDIIDYHHIDPAFGDNETFKELVEKIHEAGMKIMLDAVFNHCGFRHPYFQDVIEKGKDSPYFDCFYVIDPAKPVIDEPYQLGNRIPRSFSKRVNQDHSILNYRTFAYSPYMPKLNTIHPIMKEYLLDVATYWIKKYDIDGWRLDVSNEVSHRFWRDFRNAVKSAKPDAYIVGENWDDAFPWLQGDQYDAVMNYGFMFPIHHFFHKASNRSNISGQEFINQVNRVLLTYPKNVLESMYNLVDSHDTTRILEICDNNKSIAKLAYVMMFVLPGSPSVYYGGEVGLSGKHDPDNRRCMLWGDSQDIDMLHFMKKLIHLRKTISQMKSSTFSLIHSDQNTIFIKKGSLCVIIFNESEERLVSVPDSMKDMTYIDLFLDKETQLASTVKLSAYEFMILKES